MMTDVSVHSASVVKMTSLGGEFNIYILTNFILTVNGVTINFSFCASATNEIIYIKHKTNDALMTINHLEKEFQKPLKIEIHQRNIQNPSTYTRQKNTSQI